MPKWKSCESRKNQIYGARLNPKHCIKIDNQQESLEQRNPQRLSRKGVDCKRLAIEVICSL